MAARYGVFQGVVIYTFGSLTDDPRKASQMAGLFVSCKIPQSVAVLFLGAARLYLTMDSLLGRGVHYLRNSLDGSAL